MWARSWAKHLLILAALLMAGCAGPAQTIKGDGQARILADRAARDAVFSPKRIAVVIGINRFQDTKWNPLSYAVKDAEDLAGVLQDPQYGRFDRVTILTSPEETTAGQILQAVRQLARENLSPDDTVLLYLSSHGTLARTPDGRLHQYVVTHDTDANSVAKTAIDLEQLKQTFNELRSQKKVLVLAFCHSGQGKSRLDEALQTEMKQLKSPFFVRPIEWVSEATVVLTASAWGETAREDPSLENDIYTHFLIEGMKGHDPNGDGAVTVTEAHDFARAQTYYFTRGEQRPTIESVILGTDPIVLTGERTRNAKPVVYDYSQRYQGVQVMVDGHKKGMLPSGIAVEPGVRRVTLMLEGTDEPLFDENVTVRMGQELPIPVLLNGFNHSLAIRMGYQGFLNDTVNRSVMKPIMAYGLVYNHQIASAPMFGLRTDFAYGRDRQDLEIGATTIAADVSQLTAGAALVYRYPVRWASLYAGPRVGWLRLTRDLQVANEEREAVSTVTPGAIMGLQFRYRHHLSLSVEGSMNYTSFTLNDTTSSTTYYHVLGSLSVNF
jgi:uncharacterized caspase-like protein